MSNLYQFIVTSRRLLADLHRLATLPSLPVPISRAKNIADVFAGRGSDGLFKPTEAHKRHWQAGHPDFRGTILNHPEHGIEATINRWRAIGDAAYTEREEPAVRGAITDLMAFVPAPVINGVPTCSHFETLLPTAIRGDGGLTLRDIESKLRALESAFASSRANGGRDKAQTDHRDELLKLSKTQRKVMQYILDHPSPPVSDVLKHVWGSRRDERDTREKLGQHLGEIRDKTTFDPHFNGDFITDGLRS